MNRTILDHSDRLTGDFSPANQALFNLAIENATWLKIMNTGHFTYTDLAWTVEVSSDSQEGRSGAQHQPALVL